MPVGSRTVTPVPTSTPRPNGGTCLSSSDPIPNREHHQVPNMHYSYDVDRSVSDAPRPFDFQRPSGPPSGPESSRTDESTPTFDTTRYYPSEIPFRNQGMSPAPPQDVAAMGIYRLPQSTHPEEQLEHKPVHPGILIHRVAHRPHLQETTPPQPNTGKGGKKKSSQGNQAGPQPQPQPQPTTSGSGSYPWSAFQSRNLGTGRPHIQCTACGEYNHFRKDCHYDNFCTRCRSRSHATHMCWVPLNTGNNPICVYCRQHISTPWVTAPGSPMTTGRNPGLHHGMGSPQSRTKSGRKYEKFMITMKKIKHLLQIFNTGWPRSTKKFRQIQ